MTYSHNMNDERPPRRLLKEGWRKFQIVSCKETTSKSNNPMFVMGFVDEQTQYEDTIYAISEPKKRWFLKKILQACNVAASADGVYDWDINDILNKEIYGLVEHEPNKYINRDGVEVETTQHRIVDLKPLTAWEEEETLGD